MSNCLRRLLCVTFLVFVTHLPTNVFAEEKYVPFQTSLADLDLITVGTVKEILKPDMIRLDDDKVYVLDSIRVPPQMADITIKYMKDAILNEKVGIYVNSTNTRGSVNAQNNRIVEVEMEDATWLQREIVRQGMAWAYSTVTNRDLVLPLLRSERFARQRSLGMWSNPVFMVKGNENIGAYLNTFQVYEGVVKKVSYTKGVYYLYFGESKGTDFTVALRDAFMPLFPKKGDVKFNPEKQLRGKTLRIRGWVQDIGGPLIEWTHPEQVEYIRYGKEIAEEEARAEKKKKKIAKAPKRKKKPEQAAPIEDIGNIGNIGGGESVPPGENFSWE